MCLMMDKDVTTVVRSPEMQSRPVRTATPQLSLYYILQCHFSRLTG
ncbi:hypothetical protein L798_14976 [Zootermopsis nevadensis]|uniref:Uncharacterized protein n=1 Tax=Zootermopsis nevadensis TaxID=136037 RepID=A0A067RQ45_ZOONE|nr:hypothetical protein L798_14976 [Zootermopsis nevadensis]